MHEESCKVLFTGLFDNSVMLQCIKRRSQGCTWTGTQANHQPIELLNVQILRLYQFLLLHVTPPPPPPLG